MNIQTVTIIGDVDNGKSTLIGTLLIETQSVAEGLIDKAKKFCVDEGISFEPAYLVDYIKEEREMKSTREWALSELRVGENKIMIIDTPGQMVLSKKMISGLTQADITLIILDITEPNYKKYKYYLNLISFLNMTNCIILINKMDLVNYDEAKYKYFIDDLTDKIGLPTNLQIIPISALCGDNIQNKSPNMNWYQGPTIIEELLNHISSNKETCESNVVFPVQDTIYRNNKNVAIGKLLTDIVINKQYLHCINIDEVSRCTVSGLYHLDKPVTALMRGECGGIEAAGRIKKGSILTNSLNNFFPVKNLRARIYAIEEFDHTNSKLQIRYFKSSANISSITILKKYNYHFEDITEDKKINGAEFIDVEIEFPKEYFLASEQLRKNLSVSRQFVVENENGVIVAIGLI